MISRSATFTEYVTDGLPPLGFDRDLGSSFGSGTETRQRRPLFSSSVVSGSAPNVEETRIAMMNNQTRVDLPLTIAPRRPAAMGHQPTCCLRIFGRLLCDAKQSFAHLPGGLFAHRAHAERRISRYSMSRRVTHSADRTLECAMRIGTLAPLGGTARLSPQLCDAQKPQYRSCEHASPPGP